MQQLRYAITRKRVLLAAASVIALMILFPPFHFYFREMELNFGYSFIGMPPKAMINGGGIAASVNTVLLLTQMFAALIVGGVGYVATPKDNVILQAPLPPPIAHAAHLAPLDSLSSAKVVADLTAPNTP